MTNQSTNDPVQMARAKLCTHALSIVFPEGEDERIIRAAVQLHTELPTVRPVLVGNPEEITRKAEDLEVQLSGIQLVDPSDTSNDKTLMDAYLASRPGTAPNVARRIIRKPLFLGGLMSKLGLVDAIVAGATVPTARVIEAAMLTIGLEEGVTTPSSFFIMLQPGSSRAFVFADCAINIEPDIHEIAAIGIASARSYELLLGERSRTAFLSFSTHGSAQHAKATQMRDAAVQAKMRAPDLDFDGELQADAALVPAIAKSKIKHDSAVAGRANVLIFPDLASANIAYKLVQHLGNATALGPFLQGFSRPVSDLSRGASVQDIVDTSIITLSRAIPS